MIIDLTPFRDEQGPSRLLGIVPRRSKKVYTAWLDAQSPAFLARVELVAMNGFTDYKSAVTEELPDAVAVMHSFHLVGLAGTALGRWRQRVQPEALGHRGRFGDPLYGIQQVLLTGADLLTDQQCVRLGRVFAVLEHAQVEATSLIYQRIVAAYRIPDRQKREGRL